MILKNNGTKTQAFKWLLVDAIAPVLGVVSTLFFSVPESGWQQEATCILQELQCYC